MLIVVAHAQLISVWKLDAATGKKPWREKAKKGNGMEDKTLEQKDEQSAGRHVLSSSKLTITASDDKDLWNAPWNITLSGKEEKKIGFVTFAGEKVLGAIPIYVELDEEFRNHGYGTEAVAMMTNWAFGFRNIYEIKAETDRENDKAVKVLKKSGFVCRETEGRTERYSLTRPRTAWTGLYLFLGIFLGLILGIVLAHIVTGLVIGVVIGVSMGLSLDVKANKEREKVTGKKLK